ncbi:hypothetical protein ACB094_06G053400 [Castanea mollissima]
MEAFTYLFVYSILSTFLRTSITLDTITPTQSIRDGDTLASAGRRFQMGFFGPDNSKSRYVGIWYTISSETVVWVANRDTPLNDNSGVLKVLLNSTNSTVWSSNTSRTAENPVLQLLYNGNLVVKDSNSFDYPCDTLLPEMKLGRNFVTGLDRFLTSWKSTDDPTQGEFSLRLDLRGLPQVVVKKGDTIKARPGSWNGVGLTGYIGLTRNPLYVYEFMFDENEVYYKYKLKNSSFFARFVVNPSGIAQRFTWLDRTNRWELFSTIPADQCANYAFCGAYASCNIGNTPVCACLEGFLPKSPKAWDSVDWSDGCYTGLKLADTSSSWFDKTISLKECEELCLKNCSCAAYGNLDIRKGGSCCLLWLGNLLDTRVFADGGEDLYVRLAASELDQVEKKRRSSKKKQVGIMIGSALFVLGMIILGLVSYIWKRKLRKQAMTKRNRGKECDNVGGKEDIELPIFDLTAIANATDNFSRENKLGEGGFGSVFKGTLREGKEIAVKRLSKNSGQGLNEFKNEHCNLVKLLGFCIEENEKMLIYEYMSNKSLDSFIFGLSFYTGSKLLDWHKRINIIVGVARGLLYLHQDFRLRIIHRDLKASNILLDNYMNPKILDFGLAKSFGGDQVHGQYSIKSDVFSFGVLILEILKDRPNILMLSNESLLPKPRQPGFYTDSPEADSSCSTPFSANEMSFTLFEAR